MLLGRSRYLGRERRRPHSYLPPYFPIPDFRQNLEEVGESDIQYAQQVSMHTITQKRPAVRSVVVSAGSCARRRCRCPSYSSTIIDYLSRALEQHK